MERGRDYSPQATQVTRHRVIHIFFIINSFFEQESFNDSWMGQHNELTLQQNTFEDAVVRLHYELQRMEL